MDTKSDVPMPVMNLESGHVSRDHHVTSEVRTVAVQIAKKSHRSMFHPPLVFAQHPPEIYLEPAEVEAPETTPTTISMVRAENIPITTAQPVVNNLLADTSRTFHSEPYSLGLSEDISNTSGVSFSSLYKDNSAFPDVRTQHPNESETVSLGAQLPSVVNPKFSATSLDEFSQQDDPRRLMLENSTAFDPSFHTISNKNESVKFIRNSLGLPIAYVKKNSLTKNSAVEEILADDVLKDSLSIQTEHAKSDITDESVTIKNRNSNDSLRESAKQIIRDPPRISEKHDTSKSVIALSNYGQTNINCTHLTTVTDKVNTYKNNKTISDSDSASTIVDDVNIEASVESSSNKDTLCSYPYPEDITTSNDSENKRDFLSSENDTQRDTLSPISKYVSATDVQSEINEEAGQNVGKSRNDETSIPEFSIDPPNLETKTSETGGHPLGLKQQTEIAETQNKKISNIETREASEDKFFSSFDSADDRESRIYIERGDVTDRETDDVSSSDKLEDEHIKMEVYTASSEINYRNFNPEINESSSVETATQKNHSSVTGEKSSTDQIIAEGRPLEEPHISRVKVTYSDHPPPAPETGDDSSKKEDFFDEPMRETDVPFAGGHSGASSSSHNRDVELINANSSRSALSEVTQPSSGRIIKTSHNADSHTIPKIMDTDASEAESLGVYPQTPSLAPPMQRESISIPISEIVGQPMAPGCVAGIVMGVLLVVVVTTGSAAFYLYHRQTGIRPKVLNSDRSCANSDSGGYLDDQCRVAYVNSQGTPEDLVSLDNDSFLNSLESMTIQNLWTDSIRHTKL